MIRTADRPATGPSIGSLVRDLADESRTLLRQEVDLAKTELVEKATIVGRNVAFLAVGGMVLYIGVLALVATACIGMIVLLNRTLELDVALWLGPLIIGVVVSLVGYAFVQKAISTFKKETLAPRNTIESLRENKEWLKDQITTSDHNRR